MAQIRQFALSKGVRFIPRVGFFTLQFAPDVWSIYIDSIDVENYADLSFANGVPTYGIPPPEGATQALRNSTGYSGPPLPTAH